MKHEVLQGMRSCVCCIPVLTVLVGHSAKIPNKVKRWTQQKDNELEEPHPWNVKNSITYCDSQRNASSEEEDGFRRPDMNSTQETKTTMAPRRRKWLNVVNDDRNCIEVK